MQKCQQENLNRLYTPEGIGSALSPLLENKTQTGTDMTRQDRQYTPSNIAQHFAHHRRQRPEHRNSQERVPGGSARRRPSQIPPMMLISEKSHAMKTTFCSDSCKHHPTKILRKFFHNPPPRAGISCSWQYNQESHNSRFALAGSTAFPKGDNPNPIHRDRHLSNCKTPR